MADICERPVHVYTGEETVTQPALYAYACLAVDAGDDFAAALSRRAHLPRRLSYGPIATVMSTTRAIGATASWPSLLMERCRNCETKDQTQRRKDAKKIWLCAFASLRDHQKRSHQMYSKHAASEPSVCGGKATLSALAAGPRRLVGAGGRGWMTAGDRRAGDRRQRQCNPRPRPPSFVRGHAGADAGDRAGTTREPHRRAERAGRAGNANRPARHRSAAGCGQRWRFPSLGREGNLKILLAGWPNSSAPASRMRCRWWQR